MKRQCKREARSFVRGTVWPLFWAMMLLVRAPEFTGAFAAGDPAAFEAPTTGTPLQVASLPEATGHCAAPCPGAG
ncbi:hypothetical protein EN859_006065 [Mesorhizobium sp. M00.F.Ca.ET.216.01.1.1]|nr:hypothetical protein EN859_006065 [Mesorhizobium sp. M00.F.Ca.ET.216.01.1.1]TIS56461.1 MAG: hypothetical protein E5W91_18095 [Mesorhizobium sp.]TJW07493.1 MAG: hypothetical protein E5W82_23825 [Mesorhizobium sp.]TJW43617.1 MAG: hypothetical protein E5W83_16830 [Mesorhizobium sp.]